MTLIQPARAEKIREETESLNTVNPEIQSGNLPEEAFAHTSAAMQWRGESGGSSAAFVTQWIP